MSEIEGRPGLDDLVFREPAGEPLMSVWINSTPPNRAMLTDNEGKDWDIEDMRAALIAIHANTAPKAISLSPKNRIRAIFEICDRVVPE